MKKAQMTPKMTTKVLRDQKGMLTVDFLLAMTMSFSFAAILFVICLALTVVEATQYIAFASSRTFLGANLSRDAQIEAGNQKLAELIGSPAFNNLLTNDRWFSLGEADFNDHHNEYGYSVLNPGDAPLFTGLRLPLNLRILSFELPLMGSTGGEQAFQTVITAFMGREPSLQECQEFTAQRMNQILNADGRFNSTGASNYFVMMDNGC